MRTPMIGTMGPLFRFGILAVMAIMIMISIAPRNFATAALPAAPFRYYHFNIEIVNYTVNCQTKPIITVNGLFPGPIIYVNEGDRVIVNVTNNSGSNMTYNPGSNMTYNRGSNMTVHFHGLRQQQSCWMDGVAYITMCPVPPGDYFIHDFIVDLQRGTLLWHAHISWQRATVHGAFIISPALPEPYKKPYKDFPVILQEWWYKDVEQIESDGLATGRPFPVSDAMLINGHPGPTYNCSASEGVSTLKVKPGKTYLLRIVNAAMNEHLWFSVANHTLTVVEADGNYVFPFETDIIFTSPGQTTNVLITANQNGGTYYMSISGYGRDNIPIVRPTALFQYPTPSNASDFPYTPFLPVYNDTGTQFAFANSLKTLYPGRVPLTVNRNLFFTLQESNRLCSLPPVAAICKGISGPPYRAQASLNNITFQVPTIAILQADYFNISGVFTEDFPDNPPVTYDYTYPTSPPANLRVSNYGTRIVNVKFNDTIQLVLQDTNPLGFENHPFHLHGHNFYVLGQGFGNYDPSIDGENSLNLYNPPLRNTVSVPYRGWAVIRIKMNNPGIWLFHCHFDKHTSWGMETVFHVHNGIGPNQSYYPPPSRLMPC